MRIKFTDEEVEDLIELLENYDALTDWEVITRAHLLRKLRKAQNYSHANQLKHKSLLIYNAKRKVRRE